MRGLCRLRLIGDTRSSSRTSWPRRNKGHRANSWHKTISRCSPGARRSGETFREADRWHSGCTSSPADSGPGYARYRHTKHNDGRCEQQKPADTCGATGVAGPGECRSANLGTG